MISRNPENFDNILIALTLIESITAVNSEQYKVTLDSISKEDLIEGLAGLTIVSLKALNASRKLPDNDTMIIGVIRNIILGSLMRQAEIEENRKSQKEHDTPTDADNEHKE